MAASARGFVVMVCVVAVRCLDLDSPRGVNLGGLVVQ
jgi:hypothetical protein